VGYPMVVVETNLATTSLALHDEMDGPGAPVALHHRDPGAVHGPQALGHAADVAPWAWPSTAPAANKLPGRGRAGRDLPGSCSSSLPCALQARALLRRPVWWSGGVLLNGVNVFLVSYRPRPRRSNFHSVGEILVTAGPWPPSCSCTGCWPPTPQSLSAPKQEEMGAMKTNQTHPPRPGHSGRDHHHCLAVFLPAGHHGARNRQNPGARGKKSATPPTPGRRAGRRRTTQPHGVEPGSA
jgi:hypothetical protein